MALLSVKQQRVGGIGMGWVKGGLLDNEAFSREGEGEVSTCIGGRARNPEITKGG